MPGRKLTIAIASVFFAAVVAIANTGSVFKELYPSSADQIRRIQQNVADIRKDLASASADDLAGAIEPLKAELEGELPKQFSLLAEILKGEVSGRRLGIDHLSEGEIRELAATIAIFLGPTSMDELSDYVFVEAIAMAGLAANSGGENLVLAVASNAGHKSIEEARARLILEFARFDTLTSYFVILSEKSA